MRMSMIYGIEVKLKKPVNLGVIHDRKLEWKELRIFWHYRYIFEKEWA